MQDLRSLSDEVGGRPTGSPANLRAVEWALGRFREAGVEARKEPFTMPVLWLERSAAVTIRGGGVEFSPRVAAMPFSVGPPEGGSTAPLVDAGFGGEKDFERLGEGARGAFVLVETRELVEDDAFADVRVPSEGDGDGFLLSAVAMPVPESPAVMMSHVRILLATMGQ